MLKDTMAQALNDQVNAEFHSAYIYLSMSAYFESVGLPGMAAWMRAQTQEELLHGSKLFDFINERGGRALLQPIAAVPTAWESPLAVFEAALAHEEYVTGRINDLVDLAVSERDHATNSFLAWFVNEQVEEEATAGAIVQQLRLLGDNRGGLFMVDRELGQRVFVAPAANGQ